MHAHALATPSRAAEVNHAPIFILQRARAVYRDFFREAKDGIIGAASQSSPQLYGEQKNSPHRPEEGLGGGLSIAGAGGCSSTGGKRG